MIFQINVPDYPLPMGDAFLGQYYFRLTHPSSLCCTLFPERAIVQLVWLLHLVVGI